MREAVELSDYSCWRHEHVFLDDRHCLHERRTRLVIGLTASMMVVEIISGLLFGSMALLADGWHMASHAAALSLTALGYFMARRHASSPAFSFGTGKIGELAGYSSALVLVLIAVFMAYESVRRFFFPVSISFSQAIGVAAAGFLVNIISAFILREREDERHNGHLYGDHNLKAAYLHVLADALTSVLAIVALTAGLFLGWAWMDPLMGIVGALVISKWSFSLLRDSGRILLDMNGQEALSDRIRRTIEAEPGVRVTDLHLWHVGPGRFAAIVSLATPSPHPPSYYKELLQNFQGLSHLTLEVNPLNDGAKTHEITLPKA
jgi:cation diffusion facilitator family transporter